MVHLISQAERGAAVGEGRGSRCVTTLARMDEQINRAGGGEVLTSMISHKLHTQSILLTLSSVA